eukprot:12809317-Alexandrium_andersonii.AAC.1
MLSEQTWTVAKCRLHWCPVCCAAPVTSSRKAARGDPKSPGGRAGRRVSRDAEEALLGEVRGRAD